MKNILAILALATAMSAHGAVLYTETFGSSPSWVDRDAAEMTVSYNAGIGNGAGSLQGTFAAQGAPAVETDAFRANGTSSSGNFVGNYTAVGATDFTFDLYAATVLPSDVILRLNGGGFTFFRTITAQVASLGPTWNSMYVPLVYDSSWIGGSAANFATALGIVQWVDIQLTRNGTGAQTYYVDNFALNGAGPAGPGGASVPEPNFGIFALCVGAVLFSRRRMRKNLATAH